MEAKKRRNQYNYYGTSYQDGNTVRKLNPAVHSQRPERLAPPADPRRDQPDRGRQVQREPRYMSGINMVSLLVLTIAIATTLYFCVELLQLQSEVNMLKKDIVKQEQSLTKLKVENDAVDQQISSNYDLDYVYQVAVGEFGMVYPKDNTVIVYQSNEEGYVRQYQDIPR